MPRRRRPATRAARRASAHGAAIPRGAQVAPGRDPPYGRFGWMFPDLDECKLSGGAIDALVERMRSRPAEGSENPYTPAGFTYLGQFIDHDITFDPVSSLDQKRDPEAVINFRTPRLDLDSLYGSGPDVQPYLYDWTSSATAGAKFLIGAGENPDVEDLPRNHAGRALIGDRRNDENVIVAQLHLLFLKFHNAVVDRLGPDAEHLFETAQALVRRHYQWIVVHEFLPQVVNEATLAQVFVDADAGPKVRLDYFKWSGEPFIPIEFSGAAYRFGHSTARSRYRTQQSMTAARPLFDGLQGLKWLAEDLVIDWDLFFDLGTDAPTQHGFRIDPHIAEPLFQLPEGDRELPRRNLLRAEQFGLPSGQAVARRLRQRKLSERELGLDEPPLASFDELRERTPLWYYILCEAAAQEVPFGTGTLRGAQLGPVGGRIVAEVLLGLIKADPTSFLNTSEPWRPTLGMKAGEFWLADLIRVAQA
jgi:hypothetical protein